MSGALQNEVANEAEPIPSSKTKETSTTDNVPDNPPPVAKIHMSVSSGFYVRSLCQELGEAVDSAAMMASLVRTQQASFELGRNVFEYCDLAKGEDVWGHQIKRLLDAWNNREALGATSKSPEKVRSRDASPVRSKDDESEKDD